MNTSISSFIRKSLASLVFVAGAFAAAAHGQNGRGQVKVVIPFAFGDGTAHLNPGVYTVTLENASVMIIRGSHGAGSALSLVNVADDVHPASQGKVIFHRYGDRYFLREVWVSGSSTHLVCPRSKAEKNLQKELQLAARNQVPDGTEVALLELPH